MISLVSCELCGVLPPGENRHLSSWVWLSRSALPSPGMSLSSSASAGQPSARLWSPVPVALLLCVFLCRLSPLCSPWTGPPSPPLGSSLGSAQIPSAFATAWKLSGQSDRTVSGPSLSAAHLLGYWPSLYDVQCLENQCLYIFPGFFVFFACLKQKWKPCPCSSPWLEGAVVNSCCTISNRVSTY